MEKYSVLMSLYRKECPDYFRLALDSMLSQTVKPDEIVLVEDGPLTSELYDVIEKYKPHLKIVKNEKNLGLGLALNKGVKVCRNELVARMDTDDIAKPDRCGKQLLFFEENPTTSILGGQIEEFIDTTSNVVGRRIVPNSDIELKKYIKKRCPFNHMSVMFRKSDVLEVGNYQDWFCNEDYYLWIRLALADKKFANLSDILVDVRVGADMYQRRGGWKYYKSEKALQKLMLDKRMIGVFRYFINVSERFILQVLMPNWLRGFVFRKLARK